MVRSLLAVLSVVALLLLLHPPLSAQVYGARAEVSSSGAAQLGDRVRLTQPGLPPDARVGEVVAVSPDGMRVALDGIGERDFTWNELTAVEVAGTGDFGGTGFFLGLAGGATVGLLSGLLSGDDRSETVRRRPGNCRSGGSILPFEIIHALTCRKPSTRSRQTGRSPLQKGAIRGLVWGGAAAFVGLTVGKLVDREVWNEAPFGPPGTTLTPSVSGDGVGMSMRIPLGSR